LCGKKNVPLKVHHILERINGAGNSPANLISLCEHCHPKAHSGELELGKRKLRSKTKHSTLLDIIVSQLKKWIKNTFPKRTFIYGVRTKMIRTKVGLEKSHSNDGVAISLRNNSNNIEKLEVLVEVLHKKCVSKGDYQQYKGSHSEKKLPTGKTFGFRKFDKVLYGGEVYWIKGKMSTGYFVLMNIKGETIKLKPMAKTSTLTRLNTRKSVLV
jgi:hypothetical protein